MKPPSLLTAQLHQMSNLTDIEQEARDWRNQLEPFQYDTDSQMLAAFHKFMLSKHSDPEVSELNDELELLGSMIRAERATSIEENRKCTDDQLEITHKVLDRLRDRGLLSPPATPNTDRT